MEAQKQVEGSGASPVLALEAIALKQAEPFLRERRGLETGKWSKRSAELASASSHAIGVVERELA